MTPHQYRICVLDREGHILRSHVAACADDLEALTAAEEEALGHQVEVWECSRLVARVKANNAPLDANDRTCL